MCKDSSRTADSLALRELMNAGTWEQVLYYGRNRLSEAGIAEAELDGWYLFEEVFQISRAMYFLKSRETAAFSTEQAERYLTMISRREAREPLQHILGTQDFMGLSFLVNRHVLIPRQDTETLVETVLEENSLKDCRVLDMCTGSGCIAVSLAAMGGCSHVEAADISREALTVAEENSRRLLPPGAQVKFRQSDLFSAFSEREDRFDIIVANPPFIPSQVIDGLEPEGRDFDPRNALDGDGDGLTFYRRLAEDCGRYLKDKGRVYFEIGYDQGPAVSELLLASGFQDTKVIKDLAGKDRVVSAVWRENAGGPAL